MERCLECKRELSSLRSLHSHLKMHGGQAAYYHNWFPRRDKFDNSFIEFKKKDQYFRTFFNSKENRFAYYESLLKKGNLKEGRKTLIEEFLSNKEHKGYGFMPSHNYFLLSDLADVTVVKKFFGSCKQFCEQAEVDQIFTRQRKSGMQTSDMDDITILIDSREQKPFLFKNSIESKLDFGDYMATDEYFSKTSVDRKSLGDFKGTMGKGIGRFRKELDRAKKFGYYLFMVVEANIDQIKEDDARTQNRGNLSFIFHNLRGLLIDYSDNFQVVFCDSREHARLTTQEILYKGEDLHGCDLQYFINEEGS